MPIKLPALRHAREQAAMTQEELADAAGLHRTTVVYLEGQAASATPRTVRKLARALRVKPADLMQESQP